MESNAALEAAWEMVESGLMSYVRGEDDAQEIPVVGALRQRLEILRGDVLAQPQGANAGSATALFMEKITREGEITREGVITREHPMARVASYSGNDAPNRRVIKKKRAQAPGPRPRARGPGPCQKNSAWPSKQKKHLARPKYK